MSTIRDLFLAGDQKAGSHKRPLGLLVVVVPQLEEGSCDTRMWGEGAGRWPPLQDLWKKWEELHRAPLLWDQWTKWVELHRGPLLRDPWRKWEELHSSRGHL
jgi:hypothetical protein